MCGRFNGIAERDFAAFGVQAPERYHHSYNSAPGTYQAVMLKESPLHAELMKWGLVPFWSKGPSVKFSTINAKSETVATSPAYREPFKKRRCLVSVSGFY